MKIFVILKADYCEWSTEYGYSNVVAIKYRESHAKNKVQELKDEDGENYYYEELHISLGDIPTIVTGQFRTLMDVDAYNSTEQLNETVIAARIQEIAELKEEVRKLKQTVAYERTRADRANSVCAKTEQELRTIRNTIKAAKTVDKPKFLGFEDENGDTYAIDPTNNSRIVFPDGGTLSISELRKRKGELKPLFEARPAQ